MGLSYLAEPKELVKGRDLGSEVGMRDVEAAFADIGAEEMFWTGRLALVCSVAGELRMNVVLLDGISC